MDQALVLGMEAFCPTGHLVCCAHFTGCSSSSFSSLQQPWLTTLHRYNAMRSYRPIESTHQISRSSVLVWSDLPSFGPAAILSSAVSFAKLCGDHDSSSCCLAVWFVPWFNDCNKQSNERRVSGPTPPPCFSTLSNPDLTNHHGRRVNVSFAPWHCCYATPERRFSVRSSGLTALVEGR